MCCGCKSNVFFQRVFEYRGSKNFLVATFNFFCLSEMNSAEERKREKGRQRYIKKERKKDTGERKAKVSEFFISSANF